MLTPQEVSTHSFPKARFGGYNMAAVDEFLDTLTEDFTTLYKENTALKAKLKVLVDKVEEYRATEDSMRATLLSAQKMAEQIMSEANEESAQLLKQARDEAHTLKSEAQMEVRKEQERLRIAREESATFLSNIRRLCNSELEFLDGVPEMQIIIEQEEEDEVELHAQQVQAAVEEQTAETAQEEQASPAPAAPVLVQSSAEPAEDKAPDTEQSEEEDLSATRKVSTEDFAATRRIDFGELKFGRNYRHQNP